MRADRLLSLLMLLQARGRMTAVSLSQELEVSQRTIYRDINALSASGVPIYGEPGRDGGYSLLDSYRTSLTGLNDGEVRALFMMQIPDALTQLGVGQELKAAMLKLTAALPAVRRADEVKVRQRFYLDSTPWKSGGTAVPHLPIIHQAVWQAQKLRIAYRLPFHGIELHHIVEPYGLVAKASVWHLVHFRDGFRVQRAADLLTAQMTGESFQRQPDFDLAAFWQEWRAQQEASRSLYPVTVRVAPNAVKAVSHYFGDQVGNQIESSSGTDKVTLTLHFESLAAARARLLRFGGAIEVLEPRALRASIHDYALQIATLYQN